MQQHQKHKEVLNEFKIKVEYVLMLVKTMHLLQQLEAWQMWEQAAVIFKQIIASSNACDKDITLDTDDTADDDHCSSNSPDPTPAPKPKVIRVVKTLGQVALKTPKHKQISVTSETLVSKKGTVCKKAVTDQSGKPLRSLLHQSAAETISESPIRKSDRKVTPSKFHSAIVELLQHKEVEVHHTKSVAGGGFVTEAKKMGQKQPQQSPAVLARKTTPRKQHVVAVRKVKCNKSSPIQFSDNMGCQSVNRDTLIDGSRNVPARVEPVAMSPPISAVSIQENMRGELHESHIASDSQHDAESNTVSASQHGEVDCSALSDIQGDAESTTASENQHEAETSSINMATDIPRDVDSNNTCDSQHDPETSRPSMSLDIPQVAAELSITSGSQDESESIGIASDTQHKGVTSLTDTQETRPMLQNTLGGVDHIEVQNEVTVELQSSVVFDTVHTNEVSHTVTIQSDHDHAYGTTALADAQQTATNQGKTGRQNKKKPAETKGRSCPICGDYFKYVSNLNVHLRAHSGIRPYLCATCGRGFLTNTNLRRHMRYHTGDRPYACSFCDRRFVEKKSMQAHQRTHTGERPFKCSECDLAFAQRASLNQHMHLHTGWKGYMCDICGKSFRQQAAVKTHAKRHSGQKDWKCSTCDKGFYTKGELQRHEQVHTGERPFLCQQCPMTFTRLRYLAKHRTIHTGEKPHFCEVCNKRFRDEPSYLRHRRRHSYRQFEEGRVLKLPRDSVVLPSDPRVQEHMQTVLTSQVREAEYTLVPFQEHTTVQAPLLVLNKVSSIQDAGLMVEGDVAMETAVAEVPHSVQEMVAMETVAMEIPGLGVPDLLLQEMPETQFLDTVTVEVAQDTEVRSSIEELQAHVPL